VASTPQRKETNLRPPTRAHASPQVPTRSIRPPTGPISKRTQPKVPVSAGVNRGTPGRRSHQSRPIDPFSTPTASIDMSKLSHIGGNSANNNSGGSNSSTYSTDDDFADDDYNITRDSVVVGQPSGIEILSMPATAATGSSRPAHDVEISPERIKRSVSKQIRGVPAAEPMSHWKFER
jgi:hypothetical protein